MESGLAEAIVGYRDDPVVGPLVLVGAEEALPPLSLVARAEAQGPHTRLFLLPGVPPRAPGGVKLPPGAIDYGKMYGFQ